MQVSDQERKWWRPLESVPHLPLLKLEAQTGSEKSVLSIMKQDWTKTLSTKILLRRKILQIKGSIQNCPKRSESRNQRPQGLTEPRYVQSWGPNPVKQFVSQKDPHRSGDLEQTHHGNRNWVRQHQATGDKIKQAEPGRRRLECSHHGGGNGLAEGQDGQVS